MTSDLRDAFRAGMARAAATVNVVTTDGQAGRAGVTVSAMTSVSADGPAPTMLVCVHHGASAAPAILANGVFCANILRDDQSYIADVFARRKPAPGGDKFACCATTPGATGAPRIDGALAAFDCRVISSERIGTHHIFIGEVAEVALAPSGKPLVYAARAYGAAVRLMEPARPEGRHPLRLGTLAAFGPVLLPEVLAHYQQATGGPLPLDLHEGDQRQLIELLRDSTIELAVLLDVDLPTGLTRTRIAELAPHALLLATDPLAARAEVALADLAPRPMVLLDAPPARDYVLSLFDGPGTPNVAYRARSLDMVRAMVARGLGYALVALPTAGDLAPGGAPLVLRPLAGPRAPGRLVLARRAGETPSAEAETFLLHTTATFGPAPD